MLNAKPALFIVSIHLYMNTRIIIFQLYVPGTIGDACGDDYDCTAVINNSRCSGNCACLDGYAGNIGGSNCTKRM